MSLSIREYFSPVAASKRTHPSSSSESDSSFSERPQAKRFNMADNSELQLVLKDLTAKMDLLATKEDVTTFKQQVIQQVKDLTVEVVKRIDVVEGQVLEIENKANKVEKDVKVLQGKTSRHQSSISELERRIQTLEREQNDIQQYSRRWNLRVYRVPEAKGETMKDCTKKVCDIFTDLVGVQVKSENIEVAHRSGKPGPKPRPILVRFFDRKDRDEVLRNRRKLKNKGYVIDEDLTFANYQLSKKAAAHTATMSVWSSNGKILARLKNGQVVKLDIHCNVDEVLTRTMRGSVGGENGPP